MMVSAAASGRPFRGAFEAAVFVEQPRVEVQYPIADDVESEVPGLDDAGVDRSDRHLVRVVPAHRHGPRFERRRVVEQRPKRFVPSEAHAVEVVCFAFVPTHRRREVDDRRDAAFAVRYDTD